jgi:hypothetical protein
MAYLEGRPVLLDQPDPRFRRPGMPVDLTVPLTVSRVQRELDLERGRGAYRYEPTPIAGYDPSTSAKTMAAYAALGAAVGAGGSLLTDKISVATGALGGAGIALGFVASMAMTGS